MPIGAGPVWATSGSVFHLNSPKCMGKEEARFLTVANMGSGWFGFTSRFGKTRSSRVHHPRNVKSKQPCFKPSTNPFWPVGLAGVGHGFRTRPAWALGGA